MALLTVDEFRERYPNVAGNRTRAYEVVRAMPVGVRVKFGERTLRVNEEKFQQWVNEGGTLSDGNGGNHSQSNTAD